MSSQIELVGQNSSSGGSSKVFVSTAGKLLVTDSQLDGVITSGKLKCTVDNVTACNTGAVVISSGTVTANLSETDNGVLDAISGKLPASLDNGALKVTAGVVSTTSATLKDNATVADSAVAPTTKVDVSASVCAAVYGTLNDTAGEIKMQVSNDDTNWYTTTEFISIDSTGNFYKNFNGIGSKYFRLSYTNNSGGSKSWTVKADVKK